MSKDINIYKNQSFLAAPIRIQNFYPQYCAQLETGDTSASVTFPVKTGTIRQTVMIVNTGSVNGAFLSWGVGSATAVEIDSTTPVANTAYIPAGAVYTLDLESPDGIVDTIAAIQDLDSTFLYIHIGDGQ